MKSRNPSGTASPEEKDGPNGRPWDEAISTQVEAHAPWRLSKVRPGGFREESAAFGTREMLGQLQGQRSPAGKRVVPMFTSARVPPCYNLEAAPFMGQGAQGCIFGFSRVFSCSFHVISCDASQLEMKPGLWSEVVDLGEPGGFSWVRGWHCCLCETLGVW